MGPNSIQTFVLIKIVAVAVNKFHQLLFLSVLALILGFFNSQFVYVDQFDAQVLGDTITLPNSNNKRIEVDLTTQRLYGFENDQNIFDFPVSSGTYNRTPNGTFYIWARVKSQKMSGGSKELGNYYYLPGVPNILFFYNDDIKKQQGFSIHGAYWHNNFGVPMSHGCLNMSIPDSLTVFNWAEIGTPITIYGRYSPLSKK